MKLTLKMQEFINQIKKSIFIMIIMSFSCEKNSSISNTISQGIPLPPTDLSYSLISNSDAKLTWIDNSTNELGYKIEKKIDGGAYFLLATVSQNINSFIDTNLKTGNNYTYRVYSFNSAGNSTQYSNEITIASVSESLKNGLIAYYPLNGNGLDSSGNNLNGTIENGPTQTTDRFGRNNFAISFPGFGGVSIPHSTIFNITELSVSCWVLKGSSSLKLPGILSKCSSNNIGWYLTTKESNSYAIFFEGAYNSGGYFTLKGPTLENNIWHNIVCTYSKGIQKLYINGNLIQTAIFASNLSNSNADLYIGRKNGDDAWIGKVDDVRIHNRLLTDREIFHLTNN